MAESIIRRADESDAALLAALGAETFSLTFSNLYPPEDLAAFLAESHSVESAHGYLTDPGSAVWLLEVDGRAVGYALVGACGLPHPDVTADCGELKRIYMLPDWQGGGRGSLLMSTALGWLETHKTGSLWIGVWSGNHGAQRLYERMGFVKAGEYRFKVGNTLDHEFILRKR